MKIEFIMIICMYSLQFSFTVLNQGSTDYNNAINSIKTDIKDGDYRATLIIDESDGSTGKVTVNV